MIRLRHHHLHPCGLGDPLAEGVNSRSLRLDVEVKTPTTALVRVVSLSLVAFAVVGCGPFVVFRLVRRGREKRKEVFELPHVQLHTSNKIRQSRCCCTAHTDKMRHWGRVCTAHNE
jgi:hypothetical protein